MLQAGRAESRGIVWPRPQTGCIGRRGAVSSETIASRAVCCWLSRGLSKPTPGTVSSRLSRSSSGRGCVPDLFFFLLYRKQIPPTPATWVSSRETRRNRGLVPLERVNLQTAAREVQPFAISPSVAENFALRANPPSFCQSDWCECRQFPWNQRHAACQGARSAPTWRIQKMLSLFPWLLHLSVRAIKGPCAIPCVRKDCQR
jgi:hypothetical protein